MSAPISQPIGIVTFASALLALGVIAEPSRIFAADCLTAPGTSTLPNGHWYYRTDRTQQRKCWFLRTGEQDLKQKSVPATGEAPPQSTSSAPNSLASFKEFMAQRTGDALSDQDVKKLYAEFLEWNRRAKD